MQTRSGRHSTHRRQKKKTDRKKSGPQNAKTGAQKRSSQETGRPKSVRTEGGQLQGIRTQSREITGERDFRKKKAGSGSGKERQN